MSLGAIEIRKAVQSDINSLKALADAHKNEVGFILRPALAKNVDNREVLVATCASASALVGFVDYHHRKDAQTTLYHIVVSPDFREVGIGRKLVMALRDEAITLGKHWILLRCPENLASNGFYLSLGFHLLAMEDGKMRRLNVWRLDVVSYVT